VKFLGTKVTYTLGYCCMVTVPFGYILYCGCFNLFVLCVCVGVLVTDVLVCMVFILLVLFLCCFVYVYLFLFVLSVLV
jgi:hypothetical protein